MPPKKPSGLAPLTSALLEGAKEQPWAERLVLGGGVAFSHYIEYRATIDADFWWAEGVSAAEKTETITEIENLLRTVAEPSFPNCTVTTRRWGDTVSIDLNAGGERRFSCQIAERTTRLFPYVASPFGKIQLETLEENLASKMNALVRRGSARDFLDIYTAIKSGAITWSGCWQLWEAKNARVNRPQAMTQVALHLHAIEQRRPLESLPEARRDAAHELREFFKRELTPLGQRGEAGDTP